MNTAVTEIQIDPDDWEYFSEGAANMIFKSSNPIFKNQLLRIRKKASDNSAEIVTAAKINDFFQKHVRPVLGDYYVKNQLVNLPNNFAKTINSREPSPHQRNDSPLDEEEPHAFLMESVFNSSLSASTIKGKGYQLAICKAPDSDDTQEILFEFKPKWLLQSPNSGDKSVRCRTCALAFMRGKKPGICPLDLVSEDYSVILKAFTQLLKDSDKDPKLMNVNLPEIIATSLYKSDVFTKLIQLQKLDARGILWYKFHEEEVDDDFLLATAARDCTLFVTIKKPDPDYQLEVTDQIIDIEGSKYLSRIKLADIDYKPPSPSKREYWTGIEDKLIENDWYYRTDIQVCRALQ